MEPVIVAFEGEKNCRHIRELLERSGTASCIVCRSADQVKRAAHQLPRVAVVCGYKFADGTAEELFADLSPFCVMLMVAVQNLLDLCRNDAIFRLPAPVSRGELLASVQMLLRMAARLEQNVPARRSREEEALLRQAKQLLMRREAMTEGEAHRYLQKQSMASGRKLIQTAQLILEERA